MLIILGMITPFYGFAISLDDYAKNPVGPVLLIRHALAPGTGDPSHFKIGDCQTQRNLDATGMDQARKLGQIIKASGIRVQAIYTSQWCRCRDTAELLNAGPIKEEPGLNSFYQGHADKKSSLQRLHNQFKQINPDKGFVLMVTHFVTINALTGKNVQSGAMVGFNPETGQSVEITGYE